MAAGTISESGRSAAGHRGTGAAAGDVVSVREHRRPPPGVVRAAIGFRVDCPEGRVGILTAVLPEDDDLTADRIEIASGLFIVTAVTVGCGAVESVDHSRRRVSIGVVPDVRRSSRPAVAHRVRQFMRAGGQTLTNARERWSKGGSRDP